MANTQKYTVEQMAEALRKNAGLRAPTARALMCHPTTVTNYIEKYPELAQVEAETRESTLDLAEAKLIQNIQDGKEASIFFYLKCKGKSRGYIERERLEHTGPDGGPFEFTFNINRNGNELALPGENDEE